MEKLWGIVIGFFALSAIFAVLERLFAANKQQKTFRAGYKTDLVYWLFTPLVSATLALGVTALVIALILHVRPKGVEYALEHRHTFIMTLPVWLQAALLFLAGDIVGYWTHRWFHGRKLWKFHAIHHCSEELDWLSSVRLHPVNEILSKTAMAAVVIALGFNPKIVAVAVPFFTFYAILVHANVTWGFGWLGQLVTSPRFHRWHHTSQEEGLDKNFAGLFPWIDRIFGTYYMPKDKLPEKFGLYGEKVPEGFWGQMMYPFRKKKKKLMTGIVTFLIFIGASFSSYESFAARAPIQTIVDLKTSPACIRVETSYLVDQPSKEKWTAGKTPAIAISNDCAKDIEITSIKYTPVDLKHPALVPPYNVRLSTNAGNIWLTYSDTGKKCVYTSLKKSATKEITSSTPCNNPRINKGETLTIPINWGSLFAISGIEKDFNVLIQGTMK